MPPPKPLLYSTPLSANGRKVMALCHHLHISHILHVVNVYRGEGRTPTFLAINPLGKIPVLVDDDLTLFESNAILQYLAERYGDIRIPRRTAAGRAVVATWLFWEAAHFQPALNPVLGAFVGSRLRPDASRRPIQPVNWKDGQLIPLLQHLERHLQGRRFVVGAEISIADFALAGMATYFRAAAFPFSEYKAISDWYVRIEGLKAWRATEDPVWRTTLDAGGA